MALGVCEKLLTVKEQAHPGPSQPLNNPSLEARFLAHLARLGGLVVIRNPAGKCFTRSFEARPTREILKLVWQLKREGYLIKVSEGQWASPSSQRTAIYRVSLKGEALLKELGLWT